jgi:hypothetical protein
MKNMYLDRKKEKLDKDTLKLYTALRFGTKEHAINLGPLQALQLRSGL